MVAPLELLVELLYQELVQEVAADCNKHDLTLFLEPLSYAPDPSRKKLSADERHQAQRQELRRPAERDHVARVVAVHQDAPARLGDQGHRVLEPDDSDRHRR